MIKVWDMHAHCYSITGAGFFPVLGLNLYILLDGNFLQNDNRLIINF